MASLASPGASQAHADVCAVSLFYCSVSAGEKKVPWSSAIRAQIHLKSAWVVMGRAALHAGSQTQPPSVTYFQMVIRVGRSV